MTPNFDSEGSDRTTFAPFILHDCRDTEYNDLRLEFSEWEWLLEHFGEVLSDYELNGYGIEELVLAVRQLSNLEPELESMHLNSEGDTCYIHFKSFEDAVETATLAALMIRDVAYTRSVVDWMNNASQNKTVARSEPDSDPMQGIVKGPSHSDAITHQEAVSMRERMRRM
jgi:hypothetical protein